ncbi:MAG: UDP-N-acetylmuramoyl-tripeptide--D-alanyl-D-alanine ligase [Bacteroides sp.]|nr:UDP-N-acetylmuramoyl-tripeptide--D-alanyl-D-alanine ligase [Roseburia sp.]MCM1347365.1 UDP-N-acetylmuramoyl-tripeptide--D-alanyl-D-alanine ligase [Bacteroides sp.]MCM1421854.1 UDP-N-acetylmuramoyl-tripeptide--D-alanyl-D-alanine ligase [Bacteroides sp.]
MKIEDLYQIFTEHPEITTDSRCCPEGSIFFALKGDTFNGNAYAVKALEQGCSYAVIDEPECAVDCAGSIDKERIILVDNVLDTLQRLANYHRRHLGTTVIGITGTNGKTTTKELVAAVLSQKFNVLYTQGNFNNHIGVPKTLLRLTKDHEVAVVEMGANHPGEIKTLVEIVEPDYGLITNVGRGHLLGFGSFEGVVKTKGELYDFLREHNGKVFINNDNDLLLGISSGLELIRYGQKEASGLYTRGCLSDCNPFLALEWNGHEVPTRLIGAYNIDNALAAIAIGTYFGVEEDAICHAISAYTPSNNRSQFKRTADNALVIDTYNANPTSMAAAIDNFRNMNADNKMCILGKMGELGKYSYEEHHALVAKLLTCGFTAIWLVGEEFAEVFADNSHEDTLPLSDNIRLFSHVDEVKTVIAADKPRDKTILIKGSNSTRLFELPDLL